MFKMLFLRETVPRDGGLLFTLILAFALLLALAFATVATEFSFEAAGTRFDANDPADVFVDVAATTIFESEEEEFAAFTTITDRTFNDAATTSDLAAETTFAGVYFYRIEPTEVRNDAILTTRTLTVDGKFTDIWQNTITAIRTDVTIEGITVRIRAPDAEEFSQAGMAIITRDDEMGTIDGGLALI
jgi:hypothetical protein